MQGHSWEVADKAKGKSFMKSTKKSAKVAVARDGQPEMVTVTAISDAPVILALTAALGLAAVACSPTAGWLAHGQLPPGAGAPAAALKLRASGSSP